MVTLASMRPRLPYGQRRFSTRRGGAAHPIRRRGERGRRRYCARAGAVGLGLGSFFAAGAPAEASAFKSGGGLAASAEEDIGVQWTVPAAALRSVALPSVALPSVIFPSAGFATTGLPSVGFASTDLPAAGFAATGLCFAFFLPGSAAISGRLARFASSAWVRVGPV